MTEQEEAQLFMIYVLLSAEGRINDADYALFETIGSSIEDFPKKKDTIIREADDCLLKACDANQTRFELFTEIFSNGIKGEQDAMRTIIKYTI